jgi:hypothetical protein
MVDGKADAMASLPVQAALPVAVAVADVPFQNAHGIVREFWVGGSHSTIE